MKVSSLIDAENRVWHEEMVYELFQSKEAIMEISIPLSKMDKLIWTKSVIGQFSVKSVYFKARTTLGKEINFYEERSPI